MPFTTSDQPKEFYAVYGNVSDSNVSPGKYRGKRIPVGGCLGQARQQLWGTPSSTQHVALAGNLSAQALDDSLTTQQYKQVVADWANCMSASGHPVKRGFDIFDPFNARVIKIGYVPPPKIITEAQADLACRAQVNLVPRWSAAMTAEEEKLLQRNQAELTRQKAELQQALAKAQAVIQPQPTPS